MYQEKAGALSRPRKHVRGSRPLHAQPLMRLLASLVPAPVLVDRWGDGSTTSLVGMSVFQAISG